MTGTRVATVDYADTVAHGRPTPSPARAATTPETGCPCSGSGPARGVPSRRGRFGSHATGWRTGGTRATTVLRSESGPTPCRGEAAPVSALQAERATEPAEQADDGGAEGKAKRSEQHDGSPSIDSVTASHGRDARRDVNHRSV